eukprot:CAMPEP_0182863132 /NCGR_PEP_ID=MMETSP0034_2-20130328/6469_1 /TAXON_ID=156128 /ORGANISM="Nephroselmis pyriformis, Strain CCMP717" /LENGTH=181 /DNA_ID=CAMNT_0024995301 /DNA_START=383 /DNA_END=928 /DNA_ORIENTATION=+
MLHARLPPCCSERGLSECCWDSSVATPTSANFISGPTAVSEARQQRRADSVHPIAAGGADFGIHLYGTSTSHRAADDPGFHLDGTTIHWIPSRRHNHPLDSISTAQPSMAVLARALGGGCGGMDAKGAAGATRTGHNITAATLWTLGAMQDLAGCLPSNDTNGRRFAALRTPRRAGARQAR